MTLIDNQNEGKGSDYISHSSGSLNDGDSKWGYDLYPERKQGRSKLPEISSTLFNYQWKQLSKCEKSIYNVVKTSHLVRLLLNALKSAGCEVDIRRHFTCEKCDESVTGGYDTEMNQIVICQNTATSDSHVQGVLIHELIHMFDYCTAKIDFKNIDHLACTEIRAANLAHCSFLSAWIQGAANPFHFKKSHQYCVKEKAMRSVMAAQNVTEAIAMAAVERVFSKCYNDLEPIGRRIRRNSCDMERAYNESYLYGYM
ncbi:mitochondrial inner membrane protease ATP23 homolog [Prorops nasuta]|uniref:mitochondrial inner membrane protease ATP23 homolog n=1 Tax=Prorops nasuta TaxID=863751 RepID=UPI0034CDCE6F